ncbi:hypothetical protein HMN09_00463900 [Mycena chlorophos]|uniref:Uncharacterized protein n=1 Tax=Mycena chlorophos TaxID=658473 RepID=A0A8H6TEC9_MYCCL|nr:hypothetical protein HMN09_00463900 [Mycena chlorophos]
MTENGNENENGSIDASHRDRSRDKDKPRSSRRHPRRATDDAEDPVVAPPPPPPQIEIAPDVLRQVADAAAADAEEHNAPVPIATVGGEGEDGAEFAVIKGAEARQFAEQFIREQAAQTDRDPEDKGKAPIAPLDTWTDNDKRGIRNAMQPVVFAVVPRSTKNSHSRKQGTGASLRENAVHFFKAWQGKNEGRTHPLRGDERRASFLENEFRKVQEKLAGVSGGIPDIVRDDRDRDRPKDKAAERVKAMATSALKRAPTDPQTPPTLPPSVVQLAHHHAGPGAKGAFSSTPASSSTNARNSLLPPPQSRRSVSDPLPLPSTVTAEDIDPQALDPESPVTPITPTPLAPSMFPPPSSFPINLERPQLGTHRGSVDSLSSVQSVPFLGAISRVMGERVPLRVTNPGDRLSTLSSSASGSGSSDVGGSSSKPVGLGPSPLGMGMGDEDARSTHSHSTHVLHLPLSGVPKTGSDTSASSRSSKSRHSARSTGGKEKEKLLIVLLDEDDEDLAGHKHKHRRASSFSGSGSSGGDRGRRDTVTEKTWHGLERNLSLSHPPSRHTTPPSSGHVTPSPWLGHLMNLDEDIKYVRQSRAEREDSDDYLSDADSDGRRSAGGVVPISALVEQLHALGYGSSAYGTAPTSTYGASPYASPYASSAAALPGSLSFYGGSPYAPGISMSTSGHGHAGGSPYAHSAPALSPYQSPLYQSPLPQSRPPTPPAPWSTPYAASNYVAPTPAQGYSPFPASSPYVSPMPVPAPPLGGYGSIYAPSPALGMGGNLSINPNAQAYMAASPYHAASASASASAYMVPLPVSRAPSAAAASPYAYPRRMG